jgi:hypothetical protein
MADKRQPLRRSRKGISLVFIPDKSQRKNVDSKQFRFDSENQCLSKHEWFLENA